MAVTKDEVFDKVRTALVDALGVDEEEVTRDATLVGDLGAESIDFLDIVFKLQKAFGIEIQTSELSPQELLTNPAYVKAGVVTAEGLVKLKERMPFADLTNFEKDPKVQNFAKVLTVGDMCRFIEQKVGAQ
jgi:acyl carrier protein